MLKLPVTFDKAQDLVNRGVAWSEAKLLIWDKYQLLNRFLKPGQDNLFDDLIHHR